MRLLDHLGAHLLAGGASVGDELLRLAARRVERSTVLGEQLAAASSRSRFADVDRVLERLLARLDGARDRTEGELREDERRG